MPSASAVQSNFIFRVDNALKIKYKRSVQDHLTEPSEMHDLLRNVLIVVLQENSSNITYLKTVINDRASEIRECIHYNKPITNPLISKILPITKIQNEVTTEEKGAGPGDLSWLSIDTGNVVVDTDAEQQ